jgi:hypothetical protein
MLLTTQWSAGRPRPAISDLDGRDARRSIERGSQDERNRAEVVFQNPFAESSKIVTGPSLISSTCIVS